MKTTLLPIICLLTVYAFSQSLTDTIPIVDYHVHIFSEEMLRNLHGRGYDLRKSGFEALFQDTAAYGYIDTLISRNKAEKMLLISAGYAYRDLAGGDEQVEYLAVKRENDFLKNLVDTYPDRLIGFAGIHPLRDFADEEIIRCDEELGLHGVKMHFQSSEIDLRQETHFNRVVEVYRLCAERNLPLLIHNNAWHWNPADDYTRIFFDSVLTQVDPLTIIFAHGASGGLYDDFTHTFLTTYLARRDTPAIRRHNLYFELSGIGHDIAFPRRRPLSELHDLILEIGPEKFLFGSDYPYRTTGSYVPVIRDAFNLDEETFNEILMRDLFEGFMKR